MKKNVMVRCLSLFLTLILAFNIGIPAVSALESEVDYSSYDTYTAPKNYQPKDSAPTNENPMIRGFALEDESAEERVLLVEDKLPWNSNANSLVLNSLGVKYEKVSTANFMTKDLSKYSVVVFANDQQFSAYSNYVQFKEYLELFAEVGGVIVFGACDQGWGQGTMNAELPGNVKKANRYTARNYIEDYTHPIVTAELTNMISLLDSDLYSNYCSHTYFIEDTLPPGSKIILRDSDLKTPTLVEYPLGNGRVIASGLTWEHNYVYGGTSGRGTFSRKAMEDMFSYAIRVSNISTEGLDILRGYYLDANAHYLVVAEEDTRLPLENSYAVVNGNEYTADENGIIKIFEEPDEYEVTVYADGYRNRKLRYELKRGNARIFLMEKDPKDGKPYTTMILGKSSSSSSIYDLKTQRMYFSQGDTKDCEIEIDVEWNGNSTGTVSLYQSNRLIETAVNGKISFQPGSLNPDQKVYLHLKSNNGTTSIIEIGIVINKKSEVEKKIDDNINNDIPVFNDISLGDNQNASISNPDIEKFYPTNFTIELPMLPIKVTGKKNEKDSTYTYKGFIGLASKSANSIEDIFSNETEWTSFKDNIKNCKDILQLETKYAEKLYSIDNSLNLVPTFKTSVKAWGYIELKYDAYGNLLSQSGGVILQANAKKTFSNQLLIGPVPVYYDIAFASGFEAALGIKTNLETGLVIDGSLSLSPALDITLGAGAGINGVITVGLEGGAKLTIKLLPESQGTFSPYLRFKAYLLFLIDYKIDIASTDIKLWPQENQAAKIQTLQGMNIEDISNDITLMSMDYLQNVSQWNDSSKLFSDSKVDISPLQEYILPSTVPQIEKYNGKYIIVFQSNIEGREAVDSVGLMYSIYENGEWSNPQPVWDTGTNDLYFNMVESDNEVYLIWQKVKCNVDSDDISEILTTMLENSEICYAKLDKNTNTFTHQGFITDNETTDMQPVLVVDGDNITAVWISNKENDVFGFSNNDIMFSDLSDGIWSEPESVATINGYVSEVTASYVNGSLEIAAVSIDENGSNSISIIKDGSLSQIISDENVKSGIKYNNSNLYWVSNGVLYENSSDGSVAIGDDDVISASYKFVENDNFFSIVWLSSNDIYASINYDGNWSSPIKLLEGSKYFAETISIYDYDIRLSDNAEWSVILKNYDNEKDMTSLVHVLIKPIDDLALIYVNAEDSDRVDGIQPVDLYITNNSQNCIKKFNLKVEDSNGKVYFDNEIYCTVNPGETIKLTQNIEIGKLVKQTDFKVTIQAENEVDLSDNCFTIALGYINVGMVADRYENSKTLTMSVNVYNKSYTPANITINLIEDKPDGITIDMKNIGFLDYDKSYLYNFTIDKSKIDFGDSDVKYYYLRLDTSEYNPNEEDSTFIIVVYKEDYENQNDNGKQPLKDCEISYKITGSWDNYSNVEVTIKNNGSQPVDGWFVDLKTNGEIQNIWNSQIIDNIDGLYTLKALDYNSIINPGLSITFGFTFKGDINDLDSMLLYQNRVVEAYKVNVEVEVVNDWGYGFTGQIVISNLEDYPLENWILTFNADFDITNLWPCDFIKNNDGSCSIRGIDNNIIIQSNSDIIIGFNGLKSNESCTITDVKVEINRY